MTMNARATAVALTWLFVAGCAGVPDQSFPEPADIQTVPSRRLVLAPYETQGVTVAGTTTWYDGQTDGLSAYTVNGGFVYVNDSPRKARASTIAEDSEAVHGSPAYCGGTNHRRNLIGRFSFRFASPDDLYPESMRALTRLLAGDAPAKALHVVGYTDDIGTDEVNLPLSNARAEAIAEHLRAAWPDITVTTEGRGGCPRLVPNTTPENRAKNRRVEIYALEENE